MSYICTQLRDHQRLLRFLDPRSGAVSSPRLRSEALLVSANLVAHSFAAEDAIRTVGSCPPVGVILNP